MKMIMRIYTNDGTIWEFDLEQSFIEYGVDRMTIARKDNPDEFVILFASMIVGIEQREQSDTESISWGTSD